ncbi:MAG TPA: hypothetical protein PLV68_17325, partial [Ilumatobacteraceae bacterium]|nr:hypothetical protein [Ilumatobacteraceae bacterium]
MPDKSTIVLGIETSCDETAAAVVMGGHDILSSVVSSSIDDHVPFGGVVPEIASRAHVEQIAVLHPHIGARQGKDHHAEPAPAFRLLPLDR